MPTYHRSYRCLMMFTAPLVLLGCLPRSGQTACTATVEKAAGTCIDSDADWWAWRRAP